LANQPLATLFHIILYLVCYYIIYESLNYKYLYQHYYHFGNVLITETPMYYYVILCIYLTIMHIRNDFYFKSITFFDLYTCYVRTISFLRSELLSHIYVHSTHQYYQYINMDIVLTSIHECYNTCMYILKTSAYYYTNIKHYSDLYTYDVLTITPELLLINYVHSTNQHYNYYITVDFALTINYDRWNTCMHMYKTSAYYPTNILHYYDVYAYYVLLLTMKLCTYLTLYTLYIQTCYANFTYSPVLYTYVYNAVITINIFNFKWLIK